MSNSLGGITNRDIRDSVGSFAFNSGVLAIHGSTLSHAKTTAAVVHTSKGVFQTSYAATADIALGSLSVLSAKDGSALAAAVAMPALAAGDDAVTKVWILACKGNTAYVIEPEIVSASGDYDDYKLQCPEGYAPFGAIKVIQAPTASVGVATFVLGTTNMSGVTNQTVTFYNLSHCPALVSDLA